MPRRCNRGGISPSRRTRSNYWRLDLIVNDSHGCGIRTTQSYAGARWIREKETDDFIALDEFIVHDQNAHSLAGLAGIEGKFAERNLVIALLRCVTRL